MTRDLLQKLAKVETLKVAANYVLDDQKDDFIPDTFRHQDYLYDLNRNISRLAKSIEQGTYRARPLREIDVPKTGLSVRPGSSLHIEDHIVYFAIAYLLAPLLDKVLPKNVFHFRVKRKGNKPHPKHFFSNEHRILLTKFNRRKLRIFEDWYDAWPDFMSESESLYEELGFKFLVESDISSYFENISHPLLADVLRQHAPQQLPIINLLMEMISTWATPSLWGVRPQRGIPQGNEVSSWLGTLFLVPMDQELLKLERRGTIRFVRYVDDIKVFTKDYKTARRVVLSINNLLRRMHLNIQSSKTQIFKGEDIKARLGDDRVNDVTDILESLPDDTSKISVEQKEAALSRIKPIFEAHFSGVDGFKKDNVRLFKRCLTVLSRIDSDIAVEVCLRCIIEQPVLTDKIVRYLRKWSHQKNVQETIAKYLFASGELFDTQYLALLPLFRQSSGISQSHYKKLIRLARTKDLHWAARAEALLTMALYPLKRESFGALGKFYDREPSPQVKKVILGLFQKADNNTQGNFLKETMSEPAEEINRFRQFLWSIRRNSDQSKMVLKIMSKIESDPARLLVVLHSALGIRDVGIILQAHKIAKSNVINAQSFLVKQAFNDVVKRAEMRMIEIEKLKHADKQHNANPRSGTTSKHRKLSH